MKKLQDENDLKIITHRRKYVNKFWRLRLLKRAAISTAMIFALISFWGIYKTGNFVKTYEAAKLKIIALSAESGLIINEVLVVGQKKTEERILLQTLGVNRGFPIVAFDLNLAKTRVEALPWVLNASIERVLPDSIFLTIKERKPLALWQYGGRFSLIDDKGRVILTQGLEKYESFLIVVGADAPAHTMDLLSILKTEPDLFENVHAAIRIGNRRWDLRMKNGVSIQLPEENPMMAWRRLANYQLSHSILERDLKLLDLRLPDRLIIRQSLENKTDQLMLGQET